VFDPMLKPFSANITLISGLSDRDFFSNIRPAAGFLSLRLPFLSDLYSLSQRPPGSFSWRPAGLLHPALLLIILPTTPWLLLSIHYDYIYIAPSCRHFSRSITPVILLHTSLFASVFILFAIVWGTKRFAPRPAPVDGVSFTFQPSTFFCDPKSVTLSALRACRGQLYRSLFALAFGFLS
jgi:hypothetical protein